MIDVVKSFAMNKAEKRPRFFKIFKNRDVGFLFLQIKSFISSCCDQMWVAAAASTALGYCRLCICFDTQAAVGVMGQSRRVV